MVPFSNFKQTLIICCLIINLKDFGMARDMVKIAKKAAGGETKTRPN